MEDYRIGTEILPLHQCRSQQGDNLLEKKKYLENMLSSCHSLLGSSTKRSHDDVLHIKIDFGDNEDKIKACGVFDNKEIPYLTSIKGKSKDSADSPTDHPDRTNELVVKDIPLEIKKDDIERKFSYYGMIERIVLKVNFGWQTAHIYYVSPDTITNNFSDKWSTTLKKDSVRVYPAENFDTKITSRQLHTLKLCNLPRGTTAFDIQDYIQKVKEKTCFIPRSRGKYERVRYAFVAFANEEDKRTVLEYEEEEFIKNNKIFWTETETKTCHVCLSTQHLAAACPKIQDRRRNENRINKLADLYKRKKVEADNINTFQKRVTNNNQKKTPNLEHDRKNHNSSPLAQLEAKIAKIESFMETMQVVLQQIIDKGIAQERKEEIMAAIEKEKKKKKTSPPPTPHSKTTTTTPEQQRERNTHQSANPNDSQKLDTAIDSFNKRMTLIEKYMEKVSRYIDNDPRTQTQSLTNPEQTQTMTII